MNCFIATLAAASLISVPAAVPTAAVAGSSASNAELVAFCKTHSGTFPAETQGNCVSLLRTNAIGSAGFYAHICEFFMNSRPDDFYGAYDTYNDCILDAGTNLP